MRKYIYYVRSMSQTWHCFIGLAKGQIHKFPKWVAGPNIYKATLLGKYLVDNFISNWCRVHHCNNVRGCYFLYILLRICKAHQPGLACYRSMVLWHRQCLWLTIIDINWRDNIYRFPSGIIFIHLQLSLISIHNKRQGHVQNSNKEGALYI